MAPKKKLFVTVGTTHFDALIKEITCAKSLEVLNKLGYTDVSLQIGNGQFEPKTLTDRDGQEHSPSVSYFRLKNSISEDIAEADLVVCHAGAGSILGSLGAGKHVLVVINDELMGNHQAELAQKLSHDGHLHYCSVSNLIDTLNTASWQGCLPFPPGKPEKFAAALDEMMSFSL